jgi:hypothetical protein
MPDGWSTGFPGAPGRGLRPIAEISAERFETFVLSEPQPAVVETSEPTG